MKHLLFTTLFAATALSVSAQTFTSINLGTPQNVNGPSFALPTPVVGATYKYPNAATNVDAYITITNTTNDHTGTADAVGVFAIDNPAAVNGGYDYAFQPVVSSSNANSSGLWTKGNCGNGTVTISHSANQSYLVHFRIYFKKAGTQTDTALNLHAAFIDIDGFGSGSEAEQDAFMPGVSYAKDPNTTLTFTQRADGLINAEGDPANVTGLLLTQTTAITQVTYMNRTYVDFAFGMNTHAAQNRGGCYASASGGRLKSVSFATQPTGLTPVPTKVSITGRVWDDANGSANNTFTNINSTGEVITNGGGLYAYAIDPVSNTVIGSSVVSSVDGRYTITDLPQNETITLLLTKNVLTVGKSGVSTVGALNAGWVNTSPLIRTVAIGTASIGDLNFGIERTPTSTPYSVTIPTPAANSIKTLRTSNGLARLAGTDPEDGAMGAGYSVVITNIADLNGNQLYYNSALVAAGDTIKNYDTTLLALRFTNISTTTSAGFTFNFIDKASRGGVPATYSVNWSNTPPINPLGVKLESFNGKNQVSYNDLHWITASETNLNHYEVERSSDGKSFASIATVATRSAEGNSTIRQEYSYTDQSPIAKAYYRLKIVDNDATITYSPVITLESRNYSNGQLQVYPNPSNGTMTISGVENLSASQIHVLNASGQSTAYSVLAADANAHTTTIQLSNAPAGLYYISCESKAGVSSARILVK